MRLLPAAYALLAASFYGSASQAAEPRTPILVELFTSEGCSSCPPADALLARMQQNQPIAGAEIIVLGEHVDYWDGLGWRDRFSSPEMTARQHQYGDRFHLDSVYTPQMVVDGTTQFVGNDQNQARDAVVKAAHTAKIPLTLSVPVREERRFSATVTAAPGGEHADLYAALVDPMDTTEVRRGENSGRRLEHVAVVRTLGRIGSLKDLPLSFSLTAPAGSNPTLMQIVVFAQQSAGSARVGAVLGAVSSTAKGSPAVASAPPSGVTARRHLE